MRSQTTSMQETNLYPRRVFTDIGMDGAPKHAAVYSRTAVSGDLMRAPPEFCCERGVRSIISKEFKGRSQIG